MAATAGMVQLQEGLKLLRQKWEDTKLYWNDDARRRFEQEFLEPLEHQVKQTLAAMDRLSQQLTTAEHRVAE
jgi:hypothetical protein